MAAACGQFYDRVVSGVLCHLNQVAIAVALAAARKRKVGDGWAWSRATSESDITSLVAATLAVWALESSEVTAKPKVRSGGRYPCNSVRNRRLSAGWLPLS